MDETTQVLQALLDARELNQACALATVVETSGSIPRAVGAKMLVFPDARIVGTVGGGKFESLVIEDSIRSMQSGETMEKRYPLHEGDPNSFGAICGGDVRVFIEPQCERESITLVGAGHCSRSIATLALQLGMSVTVVDDLAEQLSDLPGNIVTESSAVDFIAGHQWSKNEALVLVSRNFALDRDALFEALRNTGAGYVGMIGSRKKVRRVFEELEAKGMSREALESVYAPIGLDIGADSPYEVAVSVLAEVMAVLRGGKACHLRDRMRTP